MATIVRSAESEVDTYLESQLSERAKQGRSRLNTDLYSGPLYLTSDPEENTGDSNDGPGVCFWGANGITGQYWGSELWREDVASLESFCEDSAPIFYEDWSGCILTREPEWEPCEDCDGDNEDCQTCGGSGGFEPSEYYAFDLSDVRRLVMGSELARTI